MITSGISQFFVILLFLMLGVLLYTFTAQQGIKNPDKSDEIFPMIATGNYFPGIVGILFIIGINRTDHLFHCRYSECTEKRGGRSQQDTQARTYRHGNRYGNHYFRFQPAE